MSGFKKNYRIVIAFIFYLRFKLIKFGNLGKAYLPGMAGPVFFRARTSDVSTFRQIFVHKAYAINLDFYPETIIDAGANIGLAAIYFADRFPEAKVISIEPEKSNFSLLEKNIGNYKNIIAKNKALSSLPNEVINIVDRGFGKWGFITEFGEIGQNDKIVDTIETTSIGQIMQQNGLATIDILKIDIEGAEKKLFESDFELWLPKTRCLIIELHDWIYEGASKTFFKAISNYNFNFHQRGENLVFINTDQNLH
jgi:FkbM family methyltransferase